MTALKALRKMLSVLLMLILVPLIWTQITVQAASSFIGDPASVKRVLQQSGLHSDLEGVLVDQLSEVFDNPDMGISFTGDEVRSIVKEVMPATRIAGYTDHLIDEAYAWFENGTDRPNLDLDLTPVRAALPAALRRVVTEKIERLPVCTTAQALLLKATYQGGMPPCKSPNPEDNRRMVEQAMPDADVQKMVPSRIDLDQQIEASAGPGFWQDAGQKAALLRSSLKLVALGWVVLALVLLALVALNLDRWFTPFGWAGTSLLLGGGFMWAISYLGMQVVPVIFGPGSGYGRQVEVAAALLASVVLSLMRGLGLTVALVGLGGIIVAVAGRLLHREPPANPEQVAS